MRTLEQYGQLVADVINNMQLPLEPAGLYEPIRYIMAGGGKRLRPLLTFACCEALGTPAEQAANQALAIEMFHNFTLLHDDVMDNADTRRGRPTVHRRWDTETAILSGDAMLTLSSMFMGKQAPYSVVEAFNAAAMAVYDGQQMDMDFENRRDVTVDEYLKMISLKTGALLSAACKIGAMMANVPNDVVEAFATFGMKLGMAFQLQDDYLDTYGDPAKFGKNIGGDIVNDKKTWLQIMALAEDHTGETSHLISGSIPPDVKIERMRRIYNRLDLPERCHLLIDSYIREATNALEGLGLDDETLRFFTAIARKSATRRN